MSNLLFVLVNVVFICRNFKWVLSVLPMSLLNLLMLFSTLVVLNWRWFCLPGAMEITEGIFCCYRRVGECCWSLVGIGQAKHAIMYRTAPTTQNYLAPNISRPRLRNPALPSWTVIVSVLIYLSTYLIICVISESVSVNCFFFFFPHCASLHAWWFLIGCQFYLVGCWKFFCILLNILELHSGPI